MKQAVFFISQIAFLTVVYQLSVLVVAFFHLPVPASVFGMILLLFLLSKQLVHIRYIQKGAFFLNKHLAFFFIPIAVGLMAYGPLIRSDGLALTAMIAGSSLIGLFITSGLTAYLSNKRRDSG